MIKYLYILFLLSFYAIHATGQDTLPGVQTQLQFKGQLSAWGHFNPKNPYPLYLGGRYIPQLNYEIRLPESRLIDFEASANVYGETGIHFFDSAYADGNINPYRVWGRYSTEQLEIRVGLQKINFGSSTMLRALRWFDQVDPRDPLQLTEGVTAILGRYYFMNNANLWLWGLYGNKNIKGFEMLKTHEKFPEFGGRLQIPALNGEAAISFHHRVSDTRELADALLIDASNPIANYEEVPENRIGLDAKWEMLVGIWFEGVWVNKSKDLGLFTNQHLLTTGTDYTFGVGSGLNVVLEHMILGFSQQPFHTSDATNFTALSVMYPFGMFDSINAIIYYDWRNRAVYNFVNWYRQFDRTTLYVMGYWNPENAQLPASGAGMNLYGGKGIQVMFVFNH